MNINLLLAGIWKLDHDAPKAKKNITTNVLGFLRTLLVFPFISKNEIKLLIILSQWLEITSVG